MNWISVKNLLPEDETHVLCYIPGVNGMLPGRDWQDSDYCIGEYIQGHWKRVDNENIEVTHWAEINQPKERLNPFEECLYDMMITSFEGLFTPERGNEDYKFFEDMIMYAITYFKKKREGKIT